jgi:periplasmic divalent cation tolerance protein
MGLIRCPATEKIMSEVVLVLSTVVDDERAEVLARTLVDERLAACVNLHAPMVSIYRWKGQVERDTERQLVIKTTRGRLPALEARLRELHSYELPELIVISVDEGSAAYLGWVVDQTG